MPKNQLVRSQVSWLPLAIVLLLDAPRLSSSVDPRYRLVHLGIETGAFEVEHPIHFGSCFSVEHERMRGHARCMVFPRVVRSYALGQQTAPFFLVITRCS